MKASHFAATAAALYQWGAVWVFVCARSSDIRHLLNLPDDEAQQELHQILLGALSDKQSENFQGEVTVMKFIGGYQSALNCGKLRQRRRKVVIPDQFSASLAFSSAR